MAAISACDCVYIPQTVTKISTAKTPDGSLVTAGEAESGSVNYCPACGQSVRVHKQQLLHGPADHFEHLEANPDCPLFGGKMRTILKRQASPTPLRFSKSET